jgi:leucyl-tRNA---protein transferase
VTVELGLPQQTEEKHDLYRRYLSERHDGQMDGSLPEFQNLLYASSVDTVEIVYRLEGRIVAVGIADREPLAWSAVYCYYDPSLSARSLGVFNVLTLIDLCRERAVPFVYLGYYVRACSAMSYKARYRPCEVRGGDGRFTRLWE